MHRLAVRSLYYYTRLRYKREYPSSSVLSGYKSKCSSLRPCPDNLFLVWCSLFRCSYVNRMAEYIYLSYTAYPMRSSFSACRQNPTQKSNDAKSLRVHAYSTRPLTEGDAALIQRVSDLHLYHTKFKNHL